MLVDSPERVTKKFNEKEVFNFPNSVQFELNFIGKLFRPTKIDFDSKIEGTTLIYYDMCRLFDRDILIKIPPYFT